MKRGRGRPSLGLKDTRVRLPEGVGERIDALMGGPNRRAEFIREAVEVELERREQELEGDRRPGEE